jgi:hypothetical protein
MLNIQRSCVTRLPCVLNPAPVCPCANYVSMPSRPPCLRHPFLHAQVPAGVVQWQLTWDQLLTTELYSLPGCTQPAGVLLHRRQRGPEPEGRIAHHIPCWGPDPMAMPPGATCGTVYAEAAAQAARLQQAIVATRARYYLSPRREVQGWSAVPVTAVEQQPNQAMPDTIPCMHYKQVRGLVVVFGGFMCVGGGGEQQVVWLTSRCLGGRCLSGLGREGRWGGPTCGEGMMLRPSGAWCLGCW